MLLSIFLTVTVGFTATIGFMMWQWMAQQEVLAKKHIRQIAEVQALQVSKQLDSALTAARDMGNSALALREAGVTERQSLNQLLIHYLSAHPQFLSMSMAFEPNAFDDKDAVWAGQSGEDPAGRYARYVDRDATGKPALHLLTDIETPGSGDYYLLPKQRHKDVIIEPYIYPYNGVDVMLTSIAAPIMRDGQYIGTWEAKELTTDMIITKMVGRELSNLYPPRSNTPGEVVFEVKDFTSINPKSFRHVNFNVRKGEILGVAGLVGAQRTELMEGLFGLRCHTSGTITYKGKELTINQPQDAIKNGIAMLTEDRRATGILGVLSIADNVSIASLNKYLIGGIMLDDNKIEKLVQDNVAKLSIKTPSSKTQIQSLSGGNQQKVLIARWLANDPDVFIMDEPTRGIDVGAKYEIYCIIAEMAKQGKSIIMISSEMSELIGMSDRIMVMCDGRCTGFIDGDKANQENIMTLATQFE